MKKANKIKKQVGRRKGSGRQLFAGGKVISGPIPAEQVDFIERFIRLHPLQASNAFAVVRLALDSFQKKIEGQ
jgi:hypothetical protein